MIKPGDLILFQGDSITYAQRDIDITAPNHAGGLGVGYANHIAARLLRTRPADNLQFYNRGISGNRIVDLYARWRIDALNLHPDLISILIGVNDTWHDFRFQNGVEVERFEAVYRMLLAYTKEQLPQIRLVLCEPFVLQFGFVTAEWTADIRQRQAVVRKLAAEFEACFVPFQAALDKALASAPPQYWLLDGVHPTLTGHRLLAESWLSVVAGLE